LTNAIIARVRICPVLPAIYSFHCCCGSSVVWVYLKNALGGTVLFIVAVVLESVFLP